MSERKKRILPKTCVLTNSNQAGEIFPQGGDFICCIIKEGLKGILAGWLWSSLGPLILSTSFSHSLSTLTNSGVAQSRQPPGNPFACYQAHWFGISNDTAFVFVGNQATVIGRQQVSVINPNLAAKLHRSSSKRRNRSRPLAERRAQRDKPGKQGTCEHRGGFCLKQMSTEAQQVMQLLRLSLTAHAARYTLTKRLPLGLAIGGLYHLTSNYCTGIYPYLVRIGLINDRLRSLTRSRYSALVSFIS